MKTLTDLMPTALQVAIECVNHSEKRSTRLRAIKSLQTFLGMFPRRSASSLSQEEVDALLAQATHTREALAAKAQRA